MQPLNFNIKRSCDNSWQMDKTHFHEDVELLLCLSNSGEILIGDSLFDIERGRLFLIDAAILHKSNASGAYERFILHLPIEIVKEASTKQSNFYEILQGGFLTSLLTEEKTLEVEELLSNLEKNQGGDFGEDIYCWVWLLSLLNTMFSSFQQQVVKSPAPNSEWEKVAPILKYIGENLETPLTLNRLSAIFFINKYHLCHIFKSATGFSVMEYIIHNRVLKSRELLRIGMQVQEVSEAVGFQNTQHFIRTFGKLTGVSPKQYAKQYLMSEKK